MSSNKVDNHEWVDFRVRCDPMTWTKVSQNTIEVANTAKLRKGFIDH